MEQGNKGQILRRTKTRLGSREHTKQIFDLGGTGEQTNLFKGNKGTGTPPPPLGSPLKRQGVLEYDVYIIQSYTISGPKDDGDFCMNTAVFVIIIIVLTSGLVVSGVSAGVMTKKVLDKASLLKQLGTGAGY